MAENSKGRKRQANATPAENTSNDEQKPPKRQRKNAKGKGKVFTGPDPVDWPEYFQDVRRSPKSCSNLFGNSPHSL